MRASGRSRRDTVYFDADEAPIAFPELQYGNYGDGCNNPQLIDPTFIDRQVKGLLHLSPQFLDFGISIGRSIALFMFVIFKLTSACHASAVQPHAIPGTSITVEEALLPHGSTVKIPIATNVTWYLCGPEDILRGSNSGYVGTIMGEPMFQLPRYSPCNVEVMETVLKVSDSTSRTVEGPGCTWSFDLSAGAVRHVQLAVRPRAPAQLYRCLSRLGLFNIGIQGALQIPDEKLFIPSSQSLWAAFPRVPAEVPMVHYLLRRCGIKARQISNLSQILQLPRCR